MRNLILLIMQIYKKLLIETHCIKTKNNNKTEIKYKKCFILFKIGDENQKKIQELKNLGNFINKQDLLNTYKLQWYKLKL